MIYLFTTKRTYVRKECEMGGSSKNNSTQNTTLGNTTTSNPYVTSTTNNAGTTTNFQNGTALKTIYDNVNQNIGNLLNEYLNPTLNSTTNQAKLKSFQTNLNNQMYANMENNIINPLTKRNMIRSSQATDMYNNASKQATNEMANYVNNLLADSQDNTANMINNLLNAYMQGYNVISNNQAQSLNTSKSNASKQTSSTQKNTDSALDWLNFVNSWRKTDSEIMKNLKFS